jgi:MYXO-CTERM domain-containing protein
MRCPILLVALAGLALAARPADACSWGPGPEGTPRFPWFIESGFPTNGLFASTLEWHYPDGRVLELVPDDALSARFGLSIRRPATPLAPGTILKPDEHCPSTTCNWQLVVGDGADMTPPPAPTVSARTLLVQDPVGAGGLSCPDTDSLELTIVGDDDTTPRAHLGLAAFIAADETQLAAKTTHDLVFGYDLGPSDVPTIATIVLGESVGRMRDGEPFRSPDRFCFALALVDWAGNVGPRSTPTCLDTTDENDPTVEWVESSGCGCRTSGRPGSWLVVLAFGFVVRRRRRR